MAASKFKTTVRNTQMGKGPSRLYLLVLRGDRFDAHPLPDSGEIKIGRDENCHIVIDHPSISRTHAAIHLGPPLAIRDLGSANGTEVGEVKLEPERAAPLSFNEAIVLGSITVILQRRTNPIRAQRIRDHDYFEGRLAEECARARDTDGTFAVLRVRCMTPVPIGVIRRGLVEALRPYDVAAQYGPQEYEVLLADAETSDVDLTIQSLHSAFGELASQVKIGVALYPNHGQDAETLISHAGDGARDRSAPTSVVLNDPAMKHLYSLAERVASGNISVLILGETGAGKEVLAEYIHRHSNRSEKPFLRLNCAALTDSLFQSELFGHEKGAFTGAQTAKPGLLETADGGTVFLDEVGELTMSAQVKLLRVLEDQKVLRVGGLKPRKINVRIIAATNRDLEDKELFREDLYYRIAGATLAIPPLRERVSEISDLAASFLSRSAEELGIGVPTLTPAAKKLLEEYSWPGNIRELRNMMERAVLLSGGTELKPDHLPVQKMTSTFGQPTGQLTTSTPRTGPQNDERQRILDALTASGGNQTEAAKTLGISRRTLAKRLETYGIPRPRKR